MAQFDQYGRLVRKASNALPHYQAYTDWDILESSSSNDNWWTRLDNAVRCFGNWYDGFYPKITSFFCCGCFGSRTSIFSDSCCWNICQRGNLNGNPKFNF